MLESILYTVFSLPYLLIGVGLAGFIDYKIYKSKATSRFTFTEIWACIFLWPMVVYYFLKGFFDN